MKAAISALTFLLFCSPGIAFAGQPQYPDQFPFFAPIKGTLQKGALYRVALPEEILGNCARNCSDARIFDQDKNEIPFVIIESRGINGRSENYVFGITGYEETPEAETVTMRLPEKHRAISTIRISTRDRDFRKKVRVYGSKEMKTWTLLMEDSIWDFSSQVDLRKTEINFPETDYRYYRIVFKNVKEKEIKGETIRLKYQGLDFSVQNGRSGRIRIDRIEGSAPLSEVKTVYDRAASARFSPRKDGDCTVVDIEARVPFERVSFDIANSYYFRKVVIYQSDTGKEGSYRFIAMGQVYSFPLSDTKETRNRIECPGSGKGHYRFVIENRNNPPLEIRNIEFEWVRRNIYFIALGDSSQYALWFGNSSLKRPEYDIAHFINQWNWHTLSAKELEIAQVKQSNSFRPAPGEDKQAGTEKAILTIIIVLTVSVIGYWLYSMVRDADSNKRSK